MLYVTAEREEKLAEEERDRLLSATHNDDDPSKLTSTGVSSSIKDVHISDGHQDKVTSLFRRSFSASKSHRRVVSRDSDSDEDCIGPPVPCTKSGQLQQPTHDTDDESDDDEIGPAAPTAETLHNVNQATDEQPESSDEEIGPPLPDAAASTSEQNDGGSNEARANDDDDDDDSVDGSDEVAVFVFIDYCISKCYPLWICINCNKW